MSRLILAPVGNQPTAVLAPLLADPVKPRDGDRVILLATGESRADAGRIRTWLVDRAGIPGKSVDPPEEETLSDEWLQDQLRRTPSVAQIWCLTNGCHVRLLRKIHQVLLRQSFPVVMIQGRDTTARVTDALCRSIPEWPGTIEPPDLCRPGTDDVRLLLDTLYEASFDPDSPVPRILESRRADGNDRLAGVVNLLERSGLLFARIDASSWTPKQYRQFTLRRRMLQRLGLEPRRILLDLEGNRQRDSLSQRAAEDGIPCVQLLGGLSNTQWKRRIQNGEGLSLPDQQLPTSIVAGPPPPDDESRSCGWWTGPPLVVAMGTNPLTTLTAIWSTEPADLVVLIDGKSPPSRRLASQLSMTPELGAKRLRTVDFNAEGDLLARLDTLWERPVPDRVDVNVQPGDRYVQLRLIAWASQCPWRKIHYLAGARAVPEDPGLSGGETAKVPVELVLAMNSPTGQVEACKCGSLTLLEEKLARGLVEAITSTGELRNWARLHDRTKAPRVIEDHGARFLVTSRGRFDYEQSPLLELRDVFDTVGEQPARHSPPDKTDKSGFWFEWVVASWLTLVGIPVVVKNVRIPWQGRPSVDRDGNPVFRDELDIVTWLDGSLCYWSCKTGSPDLGADADEARAQANRLIGTGSPVRLVLPRIRDGLMAEFERDSEGVWKRAQAYDPSGESDVLVVDLTTLCDPKQALCLARGKRRGPPGSGGARTATGTGETTPAAVDAAASAPDGSSRPAGDREASTELTRQLQDAAGTADRSRRLVRVVAVLSRALAGLGLRPVLVGGGAVEFYTGAGYQTEDIDLVAPSSPALEEAMRALGFARTGKDFHHPGLDLYVEFPSAHLQPGERAVEIDVDGVPTLVVSPEDLILDRLRAFVYWRSLRDGLNILTLLACAIAITLDRNLIEQMASKENLQDAWRELTALADAKTDLADELLDDRLRRILHNG